MGTYNCKKCGSKKVVLEESGCQTGLYCSECNSWIKWVDKKEKPVVLNYIESLNNKEEIDKDILLEIGNILGQREMLFTIQKQALVNNGIVDMKILASLSKFLEIKESLSDIENYSMKIDIDIKNSSIEIANKYTGGDNCEA